MTLITPEHRAYLEALRRSGTVNMYGAAPYVAREFELTTREARRVVGEWIKEHTVQGELAL